MENLNTDKLFNNPDSFAMVFDLAWEINISKKKENHSLSLEKKLNIVFENINHHPFSSSSPKQAKEIALFRIKLLKLDQKDLG